MTTPAQALADYQRYKASGAADPLAATAPDPAGEAHAAALTHASMLLTPAYRAAEQQRAEAERPAGPAPRETLRSAHQARAGAQAEAERLRSALARAREHLAATTATRDAAQRDLETVEAAHTTQLIDELTSAGSAGHVEQPAGEKRAALVDAEHVVAIASRAVGQLAGDLQAAEQRLQQAGARVTQAVCALLLEVAQREAAAILRAADELDARRAALDALGVVVTQQQRAGGAARLAWPS
jgi:cysteinyl-tRNA synthetase